MTARWSPPGPGGPWSASWWTAASWRNPAIWAGPTPPWGAINSFYPCVNSQQVLLANQNTDGVAEFFAQLGYTMDVQSGYWADGTGKRASLRLLVYTGST